MTAEWRGKSVWILPRTPEMLAALEGHEARLADPASEERQQPVMEFIGGATRNRTGVHGLQAAQSSVLARVSGPLPVGSATSRTRRCVAEARVMPRISAF